MLAGLQWDKDQTENEETKILGNDSIRTGVTLQQNSIQGEKSVKIDAKEELIESKKVASFEHLPTKGKPEEFFRR